MSISHFAFKQFTVWQQPGMMKVCTDSCLFGAWLAHQLANEEIGHALDIGTGTGLLSLMVAQKNKLKITAVELETVASETAKSNFEKSPFAETISLKHADIRKFESPPFDFIFSNPPFYEGDLKSPRKTVNMARHDDTLSFEELLSSVEGLLKQKGEFAIMIPATRRNNFVSRASQKGFFLKLEATIYQSPGHSPFRSFLWFSRMEKQVSHEELLIRSANQEYTPAFKTLLADYYLKL